MTRYPAKTLGLAGFGIMLFLSVSDAIAQQAADKPAPNTSTTPAVTPKKAKKVWTNDDIPGRSPDTPSNSGGTSGQKAGSSDSAKAQSSTGGADGPVPVGFSHARPARQLMRAWTDKSLWVKQPAIIGGADCFDFKKFNDCEIWTLDKNMHAKRAGGRMCQVSEFIADKEPGHVPGDYGLIIGGIGKSYTVSFPEKVTDATQTFQMRDSLSGWSFEVFDGPCSSRAHN